MKTLLSTVAVATFLMSGAAFADESDMKEHGMKGPGMSGAHADRQSEMQSRMHNDEDRRGGRFGKEHADTGKHGGHPGSAAGHHGRGHDEHDDDDGPRHKTKMGRGHS